MPQRGPTAAPTTSDTTAIPTHNAKKYGDGEIYKWRLVNGKEVLTYRGAETGLGGTSMQPMV